MPIEDVMIALAATGVWEAELKHSRQDGSEITVATRWPSQAQADDEISGFLQINTDITERKRALGADSGERTMLSSARRFHAPDRMDSHSGRTG